MRDKINTDNNFSDKSLDVMRAKADEIGVDFEKYIETIDKLFSAMKTTTAIIQMADGKGDVINNKG